MGRHKFFNLLRYDLFYGFWSNRNKWIVCIALFIFLADTSIKECNIMNEDLGFLGFLTYVSLGSVEYIKTATSKFELPVVWLIYHAYLLFLVCLYPMNDLNGAGQKVLVLSGKRRGWWWSKIFWSIFTTISYYAIFYIILFCMALLYGNPKGSPESLLEVFGLDLSLLTGSEFIAIWILLPLLCSITLVMIQMLICLVYKPMIAYIVSLLILVSSAYKIHPLLLGNYAMVLRNRSFIENGVVTSTSIFICMIVSIFAIIMSLIIIKRKDILGHL